MNKSFVESYLHEYHSIPNCPLPDLFNFPHQYTPNPWAESASNQLQKLIPDSFSHNFDYMGKMFGVLVVNTPLGIRFIAAFSGKIDESTTIPGFVPPIYNTLDQEAFFKKGEHSLNRLNLEIKTIEQSKKYGDLIQEKAIIEETSKQEIEDYKAVILNNKRRRNEKRQEHGLSDQNKAQLNEESKREQLSFKKLKRELKIKNEEILNKIEGFLSEINSLKQHRQELSNQLQQQLFQSYVIQNFQGEKSNVLDVFNAFNGETPPSGTGECALPKLLYFAAIHGLKPISFAEFWWGKSPVGEIRKQGHFYPACRAKCEPLLKFMLSGIECESNPVLKTPISKGITTLFEDDHLLVIDKPSGMLSVPGKSNIDSAEDILKLTHPMLTFLKAVHRLDMGTSGILIFAKDAVTHTRLQLQFQKHKVKKIYIAVLEGEIKEKEGKIELPLRLNLDHRPHQMVDFKLGKKALTHFKTIEVKNNRTYIEFYPLTGRTHQLRVHSAHHLGLNCPIAGDELYGTSKDRLYLHASELTFEHPMTNMPMTLKSDFKFEF